MKQDMFFFQPTERRVFKKEIMRERPYRFMSARVLPLLLALSLCTTLPAAAFADVRLADVVMGGTVEARDLSVAQCPSIDAQYAYVMDTQGAVYFQRNADTETQIASITKVMTAIVALENTSLDTKIQVSEAAAAIGESSASLQEGDVLTLDQALTAMLVSSGNDAALAIAETLGATWATSGQSTIEAFAAKMNEKAAELGMEHSVFENPHGLDFDAYAGNLHSSAHDVALMCAHAMQNEVFRNIVKQPVANVSVLRDGETATLELQSTDEMLEEYEGACGIKTGFTALAGASFAGACERNGKTYIAVVINSSSENQRFTDCETLFDWVFAHQKTYQLINTTETAECTRNGETSTVPVVAYVAHEGWIDKTIAATVDDSNQALDVFDLEGNISQEVVFDKITEDVHVGDKLGTLTFKQHNNVVATVTMVSCQDVAAPNMIEGIGVWFQRLAAGFAHGQTHADSLLVNTTPLILDRSAL